MSQEMRKHIDAFTEFCYKKKQFEVIVSYDCSAVHNKFANKLRDDLLIDEYQSQEITKSNYKIGRTLTFDEIDTLKSEILDLFETTEIIAEAKREKRTIVSIITPSDNLFIVEEIINEDVD